MSTNVESLLQEMVSAAPGQLDLTSEAHLDLVRDYADRLLAEGDDPAGLEELESRLVQDKDATPLLVHLVVKIALSRARAMQLPDAAHVSVVFAAYKEHQRILPSNDVAGGEDFLRRKAQQLDWLTAGTKLTWDLIMVDDGCPEGSGKIAEEIIASDGLGEKVQVMYLARALEQGHPLAQRISQTSESMKGGSVQLGMGAAAMQEHANHVIVFTDADLSTHLGQTGLLVHDIVAGGFDVAIGSRREPASVVIKKGARNDRGKLFIYLWKRMIASLPDLVDTQCGFKGFAAEAVRDIVPDMIEQKFAFDIELLIRAQQRRTGSITRVPVAWIDSDELSTTTDIQPYLPMLQKISMMYRTYLPADEEAGSFADLVDSLDEAAWARLQENIPTAITDREPAVFWEFKEVSASELGKCAGIN